MRFKFDANQEYQIQAIESVAALLDGQPRVETNLKFSSICSSVSIGNQLVLDEEKVLSNLQAVQARNGLSVDRELRCIKETIKTASCNKIVHFPNFSIEMETGTGKTYVYVRTILELFRRYGLRKFIVVVPSVAVREGVMKTLQVTEKHFSELYDNCPYRYNVYDAHNISRVRQFVLADNVEIMIMTIDSFNKEKNVIWQNSDQFMGETPIHMIQATQPVLILDEPQNMESELRIRALAHLNPLFTLRYSATHRNPYNVVYRLTPFEAYRQGLVKRIVVASVVQENDTNQAFMRLEDISARKRVITARISVHKQMKDGTVKERIVIVRPGDALEEKTGRLEYAGLMVEKIDAHSGQVTIASKSGHIHLHRQQTHGVNKEAIFDAQIRYTIEEHFRRQALLKDKGIKVLSLFFIDRVDNYVHQEGIIRRLFNQAFNDLKARYATVYPEWLELDADEVQGAYFAQRSTKSGNIVFEDSKGKDNDRDKEVYDLILKDKEMLLSFPLPLDDEGTKRKKRVSFLFSHSALREGWDNPNVFQICTLNQTASDMKKRQEVGRGVRLAVTQSGERVRDEQINVLTVIANESYERYVAQLQSEIELEYGQEGLPPAPLKAGCTKAHLRKMRVLSPEFLKLWDRIKYKTRYTVTIDTQKLVAEVVPLINEVTIKPARILITEAQVQLGQENVFETAQRSASKTVRELTEVQTLPNIIDVMSNLMMYTTPTSRLTRSTLARIFTSLSKTTQEMALKNVQEFSSEAVRIIKRKLAEQLINGIHYEKTGEWYEMQQIVDHEEVEIFGKYIVPALNSNSLYNNIACDSDQEREFVYALEKRQDVKLYLKLPRWFTVQTPVGEYNPDWAIVLSDPEQPGNPDKCYLVRETKGSSSPSGLRLEELYKVTCGKKHFTDTLGVDYRVIVTANELECPQP